VVVLGVAFIQKQPMFHGIIAVMNVYKSAKAMDKRMIKNCPYSGQNLPKKLLKLPQYSDYAVFCECNPLE
jgi:hypothetical protein